MKTMNAIEINFAEICRTCLSKPTNFKDINESTANNITFSEMVEYCTSILLQVDSMDVLSSNICIDCVNQLEISYKFKRNIENAHASITKYLQARMENIKTEEVLIKDEPCDSNLLHPEMYLHTPDQEQALNSEKNLRITPQEQSFSREEPTFLNNDKNECEDETSMSEHFSSDVIGHKVLSDNGIIKLEPYKFKRNTKNAHPSVTKYLQARMENIKTEEVLIKDEPCDSNLVQPEMYLRTPDQEEALNSEINDLTTPQEQSFSREESTFLNNGENECKEETFMSEHFSSDVIGHKVLSDNDNIKLEPAGLLKWTEVDNFKCPVCLEKFDGWKYQCDMCGVTLHNDICFQFHVQGSHPQNRPHTCAFCHKAYMHLDIHVKHCNAHCCRYCFTVFDRAEVHEQHQRFECDMRDNLEVKTIFCGKMDSLPSTSLTLTSPKANETAKLVSNLLPEKSRKAYLTEYDSFNKWRSEMKVTAVSESVLLEYFSELSEKYKPSTLWRRYYILKTTLSLQENVKIVTYRKLQAFLKRKSEGFETRKASAFSPEEIQKFINTAPNELYFPTKVALIMGVMGACRSGELYNMKLSDVQDVGKAYIVKISNTKRKIPRTFTIIDNFYNICKLYINNRKNIKQDFVFLQYRKGKCTNKRVGINSFIKMGKDIAKFLELPNAETYSGHSFRRSSATLDAEETTNH